MGLYISKTISRRLWRAAGVELERSKKALETLFSKDRDGRIFLNISQLLHYTLLAVPLSPLKLDIPMMR
jgi:hypothetical protein